MNEQLRQPQPIPQQGMPIQSQPMHQQGMPIQPQPMHQQGMPIQPQPMHQQGMPIQPQPMHQQGMPIQPQPIPKQRVPMQPQPMSQKKKHKKAKVVIPIILGLFLAVVILVAFFVIDKKKTEEEIFNRFAYEDCDSAKFKLSEAYEAGEIDADTYVLQTTYSMFDSSLLDSKYQSDNQYDMAPDLIGLVEEHYDELSEETLTYVIGKIMLTDVSVDPDASSNVTEVTSNSWFTLDANAFEDGSYKVQKLDQAYLSPGGRFLFFYTTTGSSAIDAKDVESLAAEVEELSIEIEKFWDVEWEYEPSINKASTGDKQRKVLENCGIDVSVLDTAMTVYLYEPREVGSDLAWYCRSSNFFIQQATEYYLKYLGTTIVKEAPYVYSYPYIVLRTGTYDNIDALKEVFSHEITHHYMSIYTDNMSFGKKRFPSETICDLSASEVYGKKDRLGALNSHITYYYQVTYKYPAGAERTKEEARKMKGDGYIDLLWAKSYIDIVDDGAMKIKEALLEENPGEYLRTEAGDLYPLVLEDLALRNLTKEYDKPSYVVDNTPRPVREVNLLADSFTENASRNKLDYYYFPGEEVCDNGTQLYYLSDSDSKFVKIVGRKNRDYFLMNTIYPKAGDQTQIINGEDSQYKSLDEIIMIVGEPDDGVDATEEAYRIVVLTMKEQQKYRSYVGVEDYPVFNMNEKCITIYVDELAETGKIAVDGTESLSKVLAENIDQNNEEGQLMGESLNSFMVNLSSLGVDLEKFDETFPYDVIRIYSMDIDTSNRTIEELHANAISLLNKPSFHVVSIEEDDYQITVDASINPLSNTELVFSSLITTKEGIPMYYRFEFDKKK